MPAFSNGLFPDGRLVEWCSRVVHLVVAEGGGGDALDCLVLESCGGVVYGQLTSWCVNAARARKQAEGRVDLAAGVHLPGSRRTSSFRSSRRRKPALSEPDEVLEYIEHRGYTGRHPGSPICYNRMEGRREERHK